MIKLEITTSDAQMIKEALVLFEQQHSPYPALCWNSESLRNYIAFKEDEAYARYVHGA